MFVNLVFLERSMKYHVSGAHQKPRNSMRRFFPIYVSILRIRLRTRTLGSVSIAHGAGWS